MVAMTDYYGRMKGAIGSINPHDATQLGEDWMITAAAGAGVGLLSAALGGLDRKIMGVNVPVDGLLSIALGGVGLMAHGTKYHKYGPALKIASIAAGGSAAVRTFEKFFKTNIHFRGEFEDLQHGMMNIGGRHHHFHGLPAYQQGPGMGYGANAQDRLVEAARYL